MWVEEEEEEECLKVMDCEKRLLEKIVGNIIGKIMLGK